VGVSPATVRNDMTVLEREGYLTQPHTSAGRIPTEKGYRFFVDHLPPGELGPNQTRQVRSFFSHAHGELEAMLQSTSRMLSQLTSTTAVVIGEPQEASTFRSVQLVSLGPNTYLVVAVTSSGAVLKRTVEHAAAVTDDQLAAAGKAVAAAVVGARAGSVIAPVPPIGDPVADAVSIDAVAALREAVADDGTKVFVEGAARMADAFDAVPTLRQVLGLLEQQVAVVSLLNDVLDRGLTVAIGSETGVEPLAECALVVAPYVVGGEQAGTIAVLGPARMNYPETLAAVAVVSSRLSRLLTEG